MRTLLSAAQQVQFQTEVSNLLKKRLQQSDGRQLVSVKLQIAKDRVGVAAIVQTSRFIRTSGSASTPGRAYRSYRTPGAT